VRWLETEGLTRPARSYQPDPSRDSAGLLGSGNPVAFGIPSHRAERRHKADLDDLKRHYKQQGQGPRPSNETMDRLWKELRDPAGGVIVAVIIAVGIFIYANWDSFSPIGTLAKTKWLGGPGTGHIKSLDEPAVRCGVSGIEMLFWAQANTRGSGFDSSRLHFRRLPDCMASTFRRHLRSCRLFGPGGRDARVDKCKCPFHVDGDYNGQRVRRSLKTRSRQLADRRLAELIREFDAQSSNQPGTGSTAEESRVPATARVYLSEAVDRFLKTYGEIGPDGRFRGDAEYGTWKKYRCALRFLMAFCETGGIIAIASVTTNVGGLPWHADDW